MSCWAVSYPQCSNALRWERKPKAWPCGLWVPNYRRLFHLTHFHRFPNGPLVALEPHTSGERPASLMPIRASCAYVVCGQFQLRLSYASGPPEGTNLRALLCCLRALQSFTSCLRYLLITSVTRLSRGISHSPSHSVIFSFSGGLRPDL